MKGEAAPFISSRQRIDAHVRSGLDIYMLSFVGLSIENLHSNGTGTVEARVLVNEYLE